LPASDNKPSINAVITLDFLVDKSCVNPEGTLIGEDAEFQITITNQSSVPIDFVLNDASADPPLVDVGVGPVAADGGIYQTTITVPTDDECEDDQLVSNEVIVEGYYDGELFNTKSDNDDCPVICPPGFTVEKICLTEPIVDEPNAPFRITITNTGYVPLDFEIDDEAAGIMDYVTPTVNPDDPPFVMDVEVPVECINGQVSNRVVVTALDPDTGEPVDLESLPAEAVCSCGNEGCTPGYWKNSPGCWCDAYTPTTLLNDPNLFDFSGTPAKVAALGNKTMMEALNFRGGRYKIHKTRILLRHATAAVLNACNENISYPGGDVDAVVAIVDDILQNWGSKTARQILKQAREFDDWNNSGCPISADNAPEGVRCERHDEEIDGEVI
jgi:hypothetical protein